MTRPALGTQVSVSLHTLLTTPLHPPSQLPNTRWTVTSCGDQVTERSKEGTGLTQGRREQGPEHQLWAGQSVDPGPGSWSWLQEAVAVGKS